MFDDIMQAASKGGYIHEDYFYPRAWTRPLSWNESLTYLKISSPTLILCGEKDGANKKATLYLSEHIPGAELQILNHAGHELNLDAPKELGEILERFYKL